MKGSGHVARISALNGGVAVALHGLTKGLHDCGHEVEVASAEDEGAAVGAWQHARVTSYAAFTPFDFAPSLRSILRDWKAPVLHAHGLWLYSQLAVSQEARRSGRPFVVSPHGMLDPWALGESSIRKAVMRRLFVDKSLRGASCIHALCESELHSIRGLGFDGPVAVIPNGVELPDLATVMESPRVKSFLFLGRLHAKKGLTELLTAWGAGVDDWTLNIAGWGEPAYVASLRRQAEAGGSGTVRFLGPVMGADKEQLLRSSGAFVLPSHSEGLPMAVLEAWAHGLPALVSPACNLPVGFERGAAVELLPEADSIRDALERFVASDQEVGAGLAARGRDLAQSSFSWASVAGRMIEVYSWLDGGLRPPCVDLDF